MGIRKFPPTTIELTLKQNSWCIVLSDTHLSASVTNASKWLENEVVKRIEENKESGIIILNGDIIELWAGKNPSVAAALKSHPKLTNAILEFSKRPHCHVVYIVGNHDSKLGWDKTSQKIVGEKLNAKICFNLSIKLDDSKNTILFEHGHSFDKDNAISDPRDPNDSPLGQHIVQEALPLVKQTQGNLLKGIDHLAEPHQFPKFVASRVFYREILSRAWWLLVPLAIGLVGRLLLEFGVFRSGGYSLEEISQFIVVTEIAIFFNVVVVLIILVVIIQKVLKKAKDMPGQGVGVHHNDSARNFIVGNKDKNLLGFITGHTHRPELAELTHGFYANSGSATEMVEANKAYFGLPKTYISRIQLSWLELVYTSKNLEISLYRGVVNVGNQTKLESMLTKKRHSEVELNKQKSITITTR